MTPVHLRRCAARLVLAMLLAFSQQQALLHFLSHSFEQLDSRRDDGGSPHHGFCDKCLSFADFKHTLTAAAPIAPRALEHADVAAALPAATVALRLRSSYQSRAPPQLS